MSSATANGLKKPPPDFPMALLVLNVPSEEETRAMFLESVQSMIVRIEKLGSAHTSRVVHFGKQADRDYAISCLPDLMKTCTAGTKPFVRVYIPPSSRGNLTNPPRKLPFGPATLANLVTKFTLLELYHTLTDARVDQLEAAKRAAPGDKIVQMEERNSSAETRINALEKLYAASQDRIVALEGENVSARSRIDALEANLYVALLRIQEIENKVDHTLTKPTELVEVDLISWEPEELSCTGEVLSPNIE